jgi:6-bladed beta-propeller
MTKKVVKKKVASKSVKKPVTKKTVTKKVAKATVAQAVKPQQQPDVVVAQAKVEIKSAAKPVSVSKPSSKKNRIIVGMVLLLVFGLVVMESVSILKTKSDQQRAFIDQGSFGLRNGDVANRATYKGVTQLIINPLDTIYLVDNTTNRVLVYDALKKEYVFTIDKEQVGGEDFRPIAVDGDKEGNVYIVDQASQSIVKFSPEGKLLTRIPAANCDNVCVEPGGTILATEKLRMQLVRFDQTGQEVKRIGGKGKGNGKFLNVYRMDVDEKGTIYVLDLAKAGIQVFSEKGKFIRQWPLKFTPNSLTAVFVKDQKVYVNDFEGQMVWAYTTKGKPAWRIRAAWPVSPVQDSQSMYYLPNANGVGYFKLEQY